MKRGIVWGVAGVAVVLVLGVSVGAWWGVRSFLQGEALRELLGREISKATGLDGELMAFEWQGNVLRGVGYEGRGREGAAFRSLRVEEIECRWDAFALFRGVWRLDSIRVRKVEARLARGRWDSAPEAGASPVSPPWFAAFLPRELEWGVIQVEDAEVVWDEGGPTEARLSGARVDATSSGAEAWQIRLTRGTLAAPVFPPMEVALGRFLLRRDAVEVQEARLRGSGGGEARLTGTVGWKTQPAPQGELTYQFERIPAAKVIRAGWRASVSGDLQGKGVLRIAGAHTETEGEIELKNGRLRGLPAFQPLVDATSLRDWLDVPLDQAWARVRGTDGAWKAEKVLIESGQLARLEGAFELRGGNLSGLFQVGARERVVNQLPGTRTEVFKLEQNGYLWAQPGMTLSGTGDAPKEDLSPRLRGAFVKAAGKRVEEAVESVIDRARSFIP